MAANPSSIAFILNNAVLPIIAPAMYFSY